MATKEDTEYMWSKEHVDYLNSITVQPEGRPNGN